MTISTVSFYCVHIFGQSPSHLSVASTMAKRSEDSTWNPVWETEDFLESGRTYLAHLFEDTPESDYLKNPEAYQINRYLVTAEDGLKAD